MIKSSEFVKDIVEKILKTTISSRHFHKLGGSKNTLRRCVERNKGIGPASTELLTNIIIRETKYDDYKRSLILDYIKQFLNGEELIYLARNPGDIKTIVSFATAKFSKNSTDTLPNLNNTSFFNDPPTNDFKIIKARNYVLNNNKYNYALNLCSPINPKLFREALSKKYLQVALDLSDLQKAIEITCIAAQHYSIIIEVGDPLIKRFGMNAVKQIRKIEPRFPLLVEMTSTDWIDEQINLVAESGADMVLLMGVYSSSRVEKAVDSARKNKIGLIIELSPIQKASEWCNIYEEQGIDAIALIRNIDSLNRPSEMIKRVVELRQETNIPIFVSGGFTPKFIPDIMKEDWNVVIVGRSIINSPTPEKTINQILDVINKGGI